jgi:hypothetical protein
MATSQRFLRTWMFVALLSPLPAMAYIDPNTGGLIFQVLAPILAMITSAWLFARDRIKAVYYKVRRMIFPARNSQTAANPDSD